MKPIFIVFIIALSFNFLNYSYLLADESNNQVKDIKVKQLSKDYSYEIKFYPSESKESHDVTSKELLFGRLDGISPNIKIKGSIKVASQLAAKSIRVRLSKENIEAISTSGQKLFIKLRGAIGSNTLSMKFTQPSFNSLNEAFFIIEGFIDPASYKQGLDPGNYSFNIDQSLLSVEFIL